LSSFEESDARSKVVIFGVFVATMMFPS